MQHEIAPGNRRIRNERLLISVLRRFAIVLQEAVAPLFSGGEVVRERVVVVADRGGRGR